MKRLIPLVLLLFALAGCGGLFGGGSWQASALQNQHIQALAVNPGQLQTIYAGDAQNGIFVSSDGGITWKQSSAGLPLPVAIHALSFNSSGKTLYAATSAGLFASSNAARSWSLVAHLPVDTITALAFGDGQAAPVYVGTAHRGAFKSTDNGASWTSISQDLPAGEPVSSLLYNPDLKQLWLALANSLYRSTNNGASWQLMSQGLPANGVINVLAVESVVNKQDELFAGTNRGFFLSGDDGQHWAQSQVSLSHLTISSILLDTNQANVLYIATSVGVLTSQDSGQHWMVLASGLPANQATTSLVQGDANNAQIFVASHGIYLYPGTNSLFNPLRLIFIALILLFFFFLYRVLARRRRPARPLYISTGGSTAQTEENPPPDPEAGPGEQVREGQKK